MLSCEEVNTEELGIPKKWHIEVCSVLTGSMGMTGKENHFMLTAVCPHAPLVVVVEKGIMPGRASSSRLGSVMIRRSLAATVCGSKGTSGYPLGSDSKHEICSHIYSIAIPICRVIQDLPVLIVKVRSRASAKQVTEQVPPWRHPKNQPYSVCSF